MPISERSTEQIILEATAFFFFVFPAVYPDFAADSIWPVVCAKDYLKEDKTWSPEQLELFYSQVGLKARGRVSKSLKINWERRLARAEAAYYESLRQMRVDPREFQAQLDECGKCCDLRCMPDKNRAYEVATAHKLADIYNTGK